MSNYPLEVNKNLSTLSRLEEHEDMLFDKFHAQLVYVAFYLLLASFIHFLCLCLIFLIST